MIVYEITKEYAPVFAEYVPGFILSKIGKPGFHTLGEVILAGDEHYTAGFLQFYDGSSKKSHEAVITYIFVPGDERGQANAWSLFMEMNRTLSALGIKKLTVSLNHVTVNELKPYFLKMGFKESKGKPPVVVATMGDLITDKLLSVPDSDAVMPLSKAPKTEVTRVLQAFGAKQLKAIGIDSDINSDDYSFKLSMMYHSGDSDGLLLMTKRPDGGFALKFCRCMGSDVQKGIIMMLAATAKTVKQSHLSDAFCYITCYSDQTMSAIKAMNADANMKPVWQGERKL